MANIIIRVFISALIIFGAFQISKKLISSKDEVKSKQPAAVTPEVVTIEAEKSSFRPSVKSFGNVQSYFETTLTPEVDGRIVMVSPRFRVGQAVAKGEVLASLDETNYRATLASEKADLILQQSALAEEEVRSKQAAIDWTASGRDLKTASDFVLRKPQLAAAKANIESVRAAILIAEANLKRTKIVAPYDAMVTQRTASEGNFANVQSSLGMLVATEKAEVRIPLTAEQVERIDFEEKGGKKLEMTLVSPNNTDLTWKAVLTQIEPTVDPLNQVTYVIGTVENPYESKMNPLAVGSFINVFLPAKEITGAYQIPESALVNDHFVWCVSEQNELYRLNAERIQNVDSSVIIKVISEGEVDKISIVTRPLSNFRSGMKVQRYNANKAEKMKKEEASVESGDLESKEKATSN